MRRRFDSTPATRAARSFTLAGHLPTLRALLRLRRKLAVLVALGVLRHLLRLAPTLAIGLAIDRVASARAFATLTTIVTGLCLLAMLEALFTSAHRRCRADLLARIARVVPANGRRAAAARSAITDLATHLGAAPLAMGGMLAAIAMASVHLAALVALLLGIQVAITALATTAHARIARALQATETAAVAAHAASGAGRALGVIEAGAHRRAARRDAARARIAAVLERRRGATAGAVALVERLGFAAVLGLASLDVMAALLTPGALIAVTLVLRQIQGLADGLGRSWLHLVETASPTPPAPTPVRRQPSATLQIAPGEIVVIVGATGAGKSSLLRDVVQRARRDSAAIAWVEQQPLLCETSIAGNLRLAAPRADPARIAQAVRVSQLAIALPQLPHGLDQGCGARGEALPAGIRHLVALAAALARDPRILVLDALPDALDAPLRATVLAGLLSWRDATRSLVVATASPGWIAAADRIVVLEHGRVRADFRPRAARAAA